MVKVEFDNLLCALERRAGRDGCAARRAMLALCGTSLLFFLHACAQVAPAESIRLRIAWGGGDKVAWAGQIRLSEGNFKDCNSLGSETSAVANTFAESDRIHIAADDPLAYQAVDVSIDAPLSSKLTVQLANATSDDLGPAYTLPLTDLVDQSFNQPLDAAGNRILIRRVPGDSLRIVATKDHLVFSPGERWNISVQPNVVTDKHSTISARMLVARSNQLVWRTESPIEDTTRSKGPVATANLSIPIPRDEGVYDLVLSYGGARNMGIFRANGKSIERRIQFVVLSPNARSPDDRLPAWREAVSFDASEPQWWERLSRFPNWQRLSFTPRRLRGKGTATVVELDGKKASQLERGGWQTYPLPVISIGTPHILEVEYPGAHPQSLGVSIVEADPNDPTKLQSSGYGIHTPSTSWSSDGKKCRIVFWPRTRIPQVLLTNLDDHQEAVFGRIRLLDGPTRLPKREDRVSELGFRVAYMNIDDPAFYKMYAASYGTDSDSGRGLTDWVTFYESAKRMVEQLNHTGYGGVVLTCAGEGGSICPLPRMSPTPRFDTGTYFESGQDLYQKDVVEMLLRMFDREQLRLMLGLRLNAPIPELEELLRDPSQAEGIEVVDAGGNRVRSVDGTAARYNPLDDRVQRVITEIVRDIVNRYSRHPSFAGIKIELAPDTYLQLPAAGWGGDQRTIETFAREAAVETTAELAKLPTGSVVELLQSPARAAWMEWRASRITKLYANLTRELKQARPDGQMVFATNRLVDAGGLAATCLPGLPRQTSVAQSLYEMGLDLPRLAAASVTVARPTVSQPLLPLLERGPLDEFSEDPSWLDNLSSPVAFALQHQVPFRFQCEGFNQGGVFVAATSNTPLAFQVANDGSYMLEQLSHNLARDDSQGMAIGGTSVATIESPSRDRWLDTYRRLPTKPFSTVQPTPASHPVTVRYLSHGGKTYLYAVNDSPWPMQIRMAMQATEDCQYIPIGTPTADLNDDLNADTGPIIMRSAGLELRFDMQPYELVAGMMTDPSAVPHHVVATLPSTIGPALQRRVADVGNRLSSLKRPVAFNALSNPSFDKDEDANLPGWEWTDHNQVRVTRDDEISYSGPASLKIHSQQPIAWVRSEPIPIPETGRLSLQAMVRIAGSDGAQPLRLAVEGVLNGRPYYRFAELKIPPQIVRDAQSASDPQKQWLPFMLHLDDLPTTGLSELRVRFDLMGAGVVWVDDIRLFDLAMTQDEQVQLAKIIGLANYQLREGRVADCERTLRGYWPQYLLSLVPAPIASAAQVESLRLRQEQRVASAPEKPTASDATEQTTRENGSLLNRVKDLLPF